MRVSTIALLVLLMFVLNTESFSQDKIYLSKSAKQGKILSITESIISYRPSTEKNQTVNIPTRTVLLLFNEKGGYIIPAKLNFKDEQSKKIINSFITQDMSYWKADRVYKLDNSITDENISKENDTDIEFGSAGEIKKLPKHSIAIVIYQRGNHTILSTIDQCIETLFSLTGAYGGINASSVQNLSATQPVSKNNDSSASAVKDNSQNPAGSKPAKIEDLLTADLKSEFERKVDVKVKQFTNCLDRLCDKTARSEELDKTVKLALGLFINDSAIVEASSLNSEKYDRSKIKKYLDRVRGLSYDHIELEWTQINYVTNLRLDQNGNYWGIVTFEQKFTGFKDNILKYQDFTSKEAIVQIKSYTKMIEGKQTLLWDVLLGDIHVNQTGKESTL